MDATETVPLHDGRQLLPLQDPWAEPKTGRLRERRSFLTVADKNETFIRPLGETARVCVVTFVMMGAEVRLQCRRGVLRPLVRRQPNVSPEDRIWSLRPPSVSTDELAATDPGRVICRPERRARTVVWKIQTSRENQMSCRNRT